MNIEPILEPYNDNYKSIVKLEALSESDEEDEGIQMRTIASDKIQKTQLHTDKKLVCADKSPPCASIAGDHVPPNWRKDFRNIVFLIFLYFIQGIPNGLGMSIQLILTSRKVSYSNLGTFSFIFLPWTLKICWAPIVDSVYFKKIGRRKSWIVPVQLLIGIFMLSFARIIQDIVDTSSDPNKIKISNYNATIETCLCHGGSTKISNPYRNLVLDNYLLCPDSVRYNPGKISETFVC